MEQEGVPLASGFSPLFVSRKWRESPFEINNVFIILHNWFTDLAASHLGDILWIIIDNLFKSIFYLNNGAYAQKKKAFFFK